MQLNPFTNLELMFNPMLVTLWFICSTALSFRRVLVDYYRLPPRVSEWGPLSPGISFEDINRLCIGSFSVVDGIVGTSLYSSTFISTSIYNVFVGIHIRHLILHVLWWCVVLSHVASRSMVVVTFLIQWFGLFYFVFYIFAVGVALALPLCATTRLYFWAPLTYLF